MAETKCRMGGNPKRTSDQENKKSCKTGDDKYEKPSNAEVQ